MTEEAPTGSTQLLAQKLEMISGDRIEKYWPGLKEQFDELRDKRASGAMPEEEFWTELRRMFDMAEIDEEKLDRLLADR